MAEPKLASRTPVACAGCYGQYPERAHVDFRSAIEGRQVDPTNPRSPHVDWVVLCENCISAGFRLLPEQRDRTDQLQRRIAQLEERCEQVENFASTLEDALARRPDADAPREPRESRPRPGRPSTAPPRRNRYDRA